MAALFILGCIATVLWVVPIGLAHSMGRRKNRTGWPLGLLLGWVGVAIVACLSYGPSEAEVRVGELEAQRRLTELA